MLPGTLQSDRESRNRRQKEMPSKQKYNGSTSATAVVQKQTKPACSSEGMSRLLLTCWSKKKEKKDVQGSKEGDVPVSVIIPLFLSL